MNQNNQDWYVHAASWSTQYGVITADAGTFSNAVTNNALAPSLWVAQQALTTATPYNYPVVDVTERDEAQPQPEVVPPEVPALPSHMFSLVRGRGPSATKFCLGCGRARDPEDDDTAGVCLTVPIELVRERIEVSIGWLTKGTVRNHFAKMRCRRLESIEHGGEPVGRRVPIEAMERRYGDLVGVWRGRGPRVKP